MGLVTCQLAISLDGYLAGPNQSMQNPLGEGGGRVHKWHMTATGPDEAINEWLLAGNGAYIMGRKMFGGDHGPWDPAWRGWWGEDPPFHVPVFVLTHHPREPLEMQGGTTFTFVTEGVQAALDQARAAAGGRDVLIAGGAKAVQQLLAAGLLYELYLHVVPIVLGAGERLLEDVGDPKLEPVKVVASPAVTHVKYRFTR